MNRQQSKALNEAFGEMLHVSRIEKRITQKNLSEMAGISDVYLRDVENGHYTATWVIWLKLCTVLDIDIKALQRKYILPELNDRQKDK